MKTITMGAAVSLVMLTSTAFAQECSGSEGTSAGVIEIVQFRLAEDVSTADFTGAASETMRALCATEGFISRTLSQGDDGLWTDHVKWTDASSAQAAMEASMENEAFLPFIMAIDPDSISLSYQAPVVLE